MHGQRLKQPKAAGYKLCKDVCNTRRGKRHRTKVTEAPFAEAKYCGRQANTSMMAWNSGSSRDKETAAELKRGKETKGKDGKLKYLQCAFMAVLSLAGCGPLLGLTIQQVCISKCMLLRHLPKLGSEGEDVLLILLFGTYVAVNCVMCQLLWSLFRKGLRFLYVRWVACHSCLNPHGRVARWILMDPKTTRSGGVYGFRKAKYVRSETSSIQDT